MLRGGIYVVRNYNVILEERKNDTPVNSTVSKSNKSRYPAQNHEQWLYYDNGVSKAWLCETNDDGYYSLLVIIEFDSFKYVFNNLCDASWLRTLPVR